MSKDAKDAAVEDLAPLARRIAGETFDALAELMREAQSESVKLAAIKEILDRGYGRSPTQLPLPQDVPKPPLPQSAGWNEDETKTLPDPAKGS